MEISYYTTEEFNRNVFFPVSEHAFYFEREKYKLYKTEREVNEYVDKNITNS